MINATALLVAILLTSLHTPGGPINDRKETPTIFVASNSLFVSDNLGATAEPGEASASCVGADGDNSVWYVFSPRTTGVATLDTEGSDFDTILAVYNADFSQELACNDDDATNPPGDNSSRVENLAVAINRLYYVRVTGFGGASGSVHMALFSSVVQGPANDITPLPILTNVSRIGSNLFAISEGELSASCAVGGPQNDGGNSVWWSFVAPSNGLVTIDTDSFPLTSFDTIVTIQNADRTAELACNDDDPNNGPGDFSSRIEDFPAAAGQIIQLRITGWQGDEGDLFLSFFFVPTTAAEPDATPSLASLEAPAPNPSAGTTTLAFSLAASADIRLVVYDMLGREVAVVVDGPRAAGRHEVVFDGAGLPAGNYLARLEANGLSETRRLSLTR